MANALKIRELKTPGGDLRALDPGRFLCGLEFYPTDEPLQEGDRDGLAQMVHYTAYLTLNAGSPHFETSLIPHSSSLYTALRTYFGHLEGWADLPDESGALPYRALTIFLLDYYPPHPPPHEVSVFTRLTRWWRGRT